MVEVVEGQRRPRVCRVTLKGQTGFGQSAVETTRQDVFVVWSQHILKRGILRHGDRRRSGKTHPQRRSQIVNGNRRKDRRQKTKNDKTKNKESA